MTLPTTDPPDLSAYLAIDIVAEILGALDRDLPPSLYYHGPSHTREVLSETLRFALADGVAPRDLELLAIAAAYHDAGFLERYERNEAVGAAMARAAMRKTQRYGEAEMLEVENMILSTAVEDTEAGPRRTQRTELAAYLMDADWGSFGREDFFEKVEQLIGETGAERHAFMRTAALYVTTQRWLTPAAERLRAAGKEANLQQLQTRLAADHSARSA